MRYDVVVMGGGLAGYSAALAVQEAGLSCALLSVGQSALHFSSGSLEFLHTLPDGTTVYQPTQALGELTSQAPSHPYSILGAERALTLAREAEKRLASWGVSVMGGIDQGNHFRLSPLGKPVLSWLSSQDSVTIPREGIAPSWPWRKVAILQVEGFLDFSPEIIKSQLEEAGLTVTLDSFTLPDLELIRQNPSEFRSINISRVLDKEENIPLVLGAFQKISANADAVLAPACLGLGRMDYVSELSRKIGKPIKLISTLPPSLLGARFSTTLTKAFLARGGVLMPKDRAIGYELGPPGPRGAVISKLFTENHGDIPLRARYFILATGGFFSQGLTAEQNSVRESVFGLDLLETPGNRQEWTRESFFAPQPYVGFGVKTDATLRGFLAGEPFANLRCAGLVLGGFDTIRQGSGAGVALVTALAAAHAVLSEE